jgi:endonuclease G
VGDRAPLPISEFDASVSTRDEPALSQVSETEGIKPMAQSTEVKALVDDIQDLIINDEFAAAFEKLLALLDADSGDERTQSARAAVITRNSAYNRLVRDEQTGVLTRDEFKADRAKIAVALTGILDDLPDIIDPPPPSVPVPDRQRLEKIVGYNNLLEIAWLERGLIGAKSVCRIIFKTGDPQGTGFLVGNNLLMTNNHVISSPEDAAKMLAEFNYQKDVHGTFLPVARYDFDPTIFMTDQKLDYTLIGLSAADGNVAPLAQWGTLKLNPNADPVEDEHVVIVQHPGGAPKQIALTANQVIQAWEHRLFYTTDTMPGSSGSPVFNQNWEVIALHHAGGDQQMNEQGDTRFVNEGILISWIKKHLGNRWPGN